MQDLPPAKIAKTTDNTVDTKTSETVAVTENGKKEDSPMEVDVETVKEADKPEEKSDKPAEKETVVEAPVVTEDDKAMEVEQSESVEVKPTEVSQCDSIIEPIETETKPEESKTDGVVVSDKDQVPQIMETESKTEEKADTKEKTEEPVEIVSEKTEPKGVEEVKIDDVPETKVIAETVKESAVVEATKDLPVVESSEEKKIVDKKPDEKSTVDAEPIKEVSSTEPILPPILEETAEIDIMVNDDDSTVAAVPPTATDDVDDAKLNELLGEKGVALEKECEAILSKVEQVTNIDTVVDKPHVANSEPEINGHKATVDELAGTAMTEASDEKVLELPAKETPADATETTVTEAVASPDKEATENGTKATNGESETNGDSAKSNGKTNDAPELNGQSSDHKEKTNGASIETADTEIVVKKLATEDKSVEQLVDT